MAPSKLSDDFFFTLSSAHDLLKFWLGIISKPFKFLTATALMGDPSLSCFELCEGSWGPGSRGCRSPN